MPCFAYCKLVGLLLLSAICAHAAADTPSATTTGRTGEQIFQIYCAECHSTGISGAPRISDKSAWAQRIAQGQSVLLEHALRGFKNMPGRGSCSTCSDAEIKASVEFIVKKVK
jgi:cytochrome c5